MYLKSSEEASTEWKILRIKVRGQLKRQSREVDGNQAFTRFTRSLWIFLTSE